MVPVVGGYTMADIHRMAQLAANTSWSRGGDYIDRFEAAWHAIVEELLTSAEPPNRHALVAIGQVATRDDVRAEMRHRGAHPDDRTSGYGVGKNFNRYWWQRNTASPESQVVDATALRQIWPHLSEFHRQTITTYALVDGDYAKAAAAAGTTVHNFRGRLNNARRAFRALWHDGETPSLMWRQDCGPRPERQRNECGTNAAAMRHRLRKEQLCEPCRLAALEYQRERRAIQRARAS